MSGPYIVRHLDQVDAVPCPCGSAQRIITSADNENLSIHRVSIAGTAKKHYHEKLTEYYVVLSGSGQIELGSDRVEVSPGDTIMIPPRTPHALRGHFEIINIVCPPFDPDDEHIIEEA